MSKKGKLLNTFLYCLKRLLIRYNDAITGETSVGKTAFAFRIHQLSNRNNKPFIHLNCGKIPEIPHESELFGYTKGTFYRGQSEWETRFNSSG